MWSVCSAHHIATFICVEGCCIASNLVAWLVATLWLLTKMELLRAVILFFASFSI
jgi:hypothetical protein